MGFKLVKERTSLHVKFGKKGEEVSFDFENKLALIPIDKGIVTVSFDDLTFMVITSPVVLTHSSKRVSKKSDSVHKKMLNKQVGAWGTKFKVRVRGRDEEVDVGSVNSALVSRLIADAFTTYMSVDELNSIVEFSSEVEND